MSCGLVYKHKQIALATICRTSGGVDGPHGGYSWNTDRLLTLAQEWYWYLTHNFRGLKKFDPLQQNPAH
jgi:hypothetical protein